MLAVKLKIFCAKQALLEFLPLSQTMKDSNRNLSPVDQSCFMKGRLAPKASESRGLNPALRSGRDYQQWSWAV